MRIDGVHSGCRDTGAVKWLPRIIICLPKFIVPPFRDPSDKILLMYLFELDKLIRVLFGGRDPRVCSSPSVRGVILTINLGSRSSLGTLSFHA